MDALDAPLVFSIHTISIDMAAGVTPDMRDAWPRFKGFMRASFSFISDERLSMTL